MVVSDVVAVDAEPYDANASTVRKQSVALRHSTVPYDSGIRGAPGPSADETQYRGGSGGRRRELTPRQTSEGAWLGMQVPYKTRMLTYRNIIVHGSE